MFFLHFENILKILRYTDNRGNFGHYYRSVKFSYCYIPTWKILKKQQLLCVDLFMQRNLMTVPESVSSNSAELCFEWSSIVTNEWTTCGVTWRHESEAQKQWQRWAVIMFTNDMVMKL